MFSRILLATDFSDPARPSVDWAGGLATLEGGTVVVVHALEHDLVAHAPVPCCGPVAFCRRRIKVCRFEARESRS